MRTRLRRNHRRGNGLIIHHLERSRNGETIDNLRETSIDYYSTLKSIYLQSREINIINDFEEDEAFFQDSFEDFYENENDKK